MNHTQPRMNAGRPSWMAASLILWLVGAGPVAAQITPSPSFPNNRANLPVVLPGYYHQPWAGPLECVGMAGLFRNLGRRTRPTPKPGHRSSVLRESTRCKAPGGEASSRP